MRTKTKWLIGLGAVAGTLRDGTPVTLTLRGLMFCPWVYRDATGSVYLAESFAVEYTNRATRIHARWIPASPLFTHWVQTP